MKLVILTDHYPYTRGEQSFLEPELAITSRKFEVELICKDQAPVQALSVPYPVKVTQYVASFSAKDKLVNLARCACSPAWLREVFSEPAPCGRKKLEAEARNFVMQAEHLRAWMERGGYFRDGENTLFYSYWYNYGAYALTLQKKKQPGLKIITRTHGYDLYNERNACGRQLFKKEMDKRLDAVYFVCKPAREYYMEHFASREASHYRMACLGVPDRGLSPVPHSKTLHLFSCSNLIPLKRVGLLVEALALLSDIPVRWVHMGGGEQEQSIRALAREKLGSLGQTEYELTGAVAYEKILAYYRENPIDLFMTASESEGGSPVSIMEALSFGVPVLGTAAGGIPEMAVDGKSGYLLPVETSPEEIAGKLRAFYALPEEKQFALRQGARGLWQESFCDKINHEKFALGLEAYFSS